MSCTICNCVAIPNRSICPECLVENTPNIDDLDPFRYNSANLETEDLEPNQLKLLIEASKARYIKFK